MSKRRKKLPAIKKEISDFLLNEEGRITRKDIAKIGIGLTAIGMMFVPTQSVFAGHTNGYSTPDPGGHASHSSHGSHGSHASHGSHGSHSSGGWC